MPQPNLPKPVTYTVTAAGVGQPIVGSCYREAGTVVEGNPHLYGPYVEMGHLAPVEPAPKAKAKREIHDTGRIEQTA